MNTMLGYRTRKKVVSRDMELLDVHLYGYYACRKQAAAALDREGIQKCQICGRPDPWSRIVEDGSYGHDRPCQRRPCCPKSSHNRSALNVIC